CFKGMPDEAGVLLLPSSSSLQGKYRAQWRLLEQRSLLIFIHEYTRRARLAAVYISSVSRLLEHHQQHLSFCSLFQTPSTWSSCRLDLGSLSQELRVHLNHWSCLFSKVQSDHFLRRAAGRHTRLLLKIKESLDLLGLQALVLMEHYVQAILSSVFQTDLDSVPKEVLEDILTGTYHYNQVVDEQRGQHSASKLKTAVMQQARFSTLDSSLPRIKSHHPSPFSVKELMMILASYHAEMAAKQLHYWASETKCTSHSAFTQTGVEALDLVQPDPTRLESGALLQTASPLLMSSQHLRGMPPSRICQLQHSSAELLFQVFVSSSDLLAPLVSHTPTPERLNEQPLQTPVTDVVNGKVDSTILSARLPNTPDPVELHRESSKLNKDQNVERIQQEWAELEITVPDPTSPFSLFPCTLQRQTVSLVLASVQLPTVWVMSKAHQFLSSWSLNKFLLITQGDLTTKSLVMNSHGDQQSALHTHSQLLLQQQLETLERARSALQTFSSVMLRTFSSDCKQRSGEIFEHTMPPAVHWKPSHRTGFPNSPSEYASLAAQTVIGQVLEGVAPLSDDARVQALSITMTAFMEAWMEHILRQKIKFSVQGALQLKQDFDSIREMIQSDQYGLSAELHQQLLSLRVFQQVDSAVVCLLQQPQAKPYVQPRSWEPFTRCCKCHISLQRSNVPCDISEARWACFLCAHSLVLGAAQQDWLDLRIQTSARRWRLPCLSHSEH
uniref:Coiled-coil protein 142 C-terminal domain-containing protein n=1 Tax=Neolamprologus brichardi TaxID=32507 RepID=A0A3Q4ME63_NEOBR